MTELTRLTIFGPYDSDHLHPNEAGVQAVADASRPRKREFAALP
jgi:hypothetical protein